MVKSGQAWGSLVFASNYTESLIERTENPRYVDNATVDASDLGIKLDMSSRFTMQLSLIIQLV